jgi:sugar phosphate isomerase/epimerase
VTAARKITAGLQLFSVRESLAADPWGTLAEVADAGFHRLEAANHRAHIDDGVGFGVSARELRDRLADLDLSIEGCHVNPLDPQRMPAVLDYHAELGTAVLGTDIEFFAEGGLDALRRRCDVLNAVAAQCVERGIRFTYHNHFQEFQRIGDRTVYEHILESTDPDLVDLEMDLYWIYRGGQDAVAWMLRCADRVLLLHQKDFPADAPQPLSLFDGVVDIDVPVTWERFESAVSPKAFTEIGSGILPVADILDAARELPRLRTVFLEQDHTALPELESVRTSRAAFEALGGVVWR